jgi:hypothetical protein
MRKDSVSLHLDIRECEENGIPVNPVWEIIGSLIRLGVYWESDKMSSK